MKITNGFELFAVIFLIILILGAIFALFYAFYVEYLYDKYFEIKCKYIKDKSR